MARTMVLVLAILLCTPAVAQQRKPIVAVFDFDGQGVTLGRDVLERFGSYVSGRLAGSQLFQVVPRSQVKMRLAEQKVESYQECYDQSCQIAMGRELAAEKGVSGEILRMGTRCIVNLNLFDLATATADSAASSEGGCSEEEVVETLKLAVTRLIEPLEGKGAAKGPGKGPRPDPSQEPGREYAPEYRLVGRALGPSYTEVLWKRYSSKDGRMERAIMGFGERGEQSLFAGFPEWARQRLVDRRKEGENTMIAGAVLFGVGAVFAGAFGGAGWASDQDMAIGGIITTSLFAGSGVACLFSGGISYGVYNSRLKKLERSINDHASRASTPLLSFSLAPYFDTRHRGGGAQFVLAF